MATIHQINLVGNETFSESELLDTFALDTTGWMSWFTKMTNYSKQKLSADLETLRSYYLNRGYLEFNIESTQVNIGTDKEKIFITVSVNGANVTPFPMSKLVELLIPERKSAN